MSIFHNNNAMKLKITINDVSYPILISNYTAYNVNDIAKIIWSDKRHLKAIETKSYMQNARDHRFIRPSMMAYDICIERDEIMQYLDKWCHRDQKAKQNLSEFDYEDVKNKINNILRQTVETKLSKLFEQYEYQKLALNKILNNLN